MRSVEYCISFSENFSRLIVLLRFALKFVGFHEEKVLCSHLWTICIKIFHEIIGVAYLLIIHALYITIHKHDVRGLIKIVVPLGNGEFH